MTPNGSPRREPSQEALLAAYEEVCRSYHAIDDFRMKLLGLLPLASLIGLILLDSGQLLPKEPTPLSREIIGFAGIFASAMTLALFSYEVRGIRRSHNLITEGEHIEQALGIAHGQFHVCVDEHRRASGLRQAANAKLAACVIYSLVFAGWLFIALRFGFGIHTMSCSIYATTAALVVAMATYLFVRRWTAP